MPALVTYSSSAFLTSKISMMRAPLTSTGPSSQSTQAAIPWCAGYLNEAVKVTARAEAKIPE